MKKDEIRGLLKGIGITMILCTTIFYSMILNYRSDMSNTFMMTEEVIIEKARAIGMIFPTEKVIDQIENEADDSDKLDAIFEKIENE